MITFRHRLSIHVARPSISMPPTSIILSSKPVAFGAAGRTMSWPIVSELLSCADTEFILEGTHLFRTLHQAPATVSRADGYYCITRATRPPYRACLFNYQMSSCRAVYGPCDLACVWTWLSSTAQTYVSGAVCCLSFICRGNSAGWFSHHSRHQKADKIETRALVNRFTGGILASLLCRINEDSVTLDRT